MRRAMLYREQNNTQDACFYVGQIDSLPKVGERVLIHNALTKWEEEGIVSAVDAHKRVYTVAMQVPRLEQPPLFAGAEVEG